MHTLSVTELTRYLKGLVEKDSFLANLWIEGEISNFKRAPSGHLYFTMKDRFSCVRVVMFRSRAARLNFSPEDGLSVRSRGYISLYEPSGQYQLYALEMEPAGGGAMYAALERLKEKLRRQGIFEPELKKKLPRFPACIGLITSPTGAAVRDMINIIRRRWPATRIVLAPVRVQGNEAPDEIASAIQTLNKVEGVDMLIAGRGGGSLEELWPFNTETVARAIYESHLPIISAVGHETDFTLADLAADMRASTPSAAAEIAVPLARDSKRHLDNLTFNLIRSLRNNLEENRKRIHTCLTNPVITRPEEYVTGKRRQAVDELSEKMQRLTVGILNRDRHRLGVSAGRLQTLSPLATLARGYSICHSPGGEIIKNYSQVRPGSAVNVTLSEGSLRCRVEESLPSGKNHHHKE